MVKTACITGASRGIGKGIALALAGLGYRVILVARDQKALEKVRKEISQKEGSLEPLIYPLDVRDRNDVTCAIDDAYKKEKRIDLLVNAAGILLPGMDFRHVKELIEVNLLGALHCIEASVNYMKQAQSGYIFNISSRAGKVGIKGLQGYCVSKFALMGLNDSLCAELAEDGIKVTAICPSFVDTEMCRHANIPKEDRIPVEDIVKTVLFLLRISSNSCIREVSLECRKKVIETFTSSLDFPAGKG